MSGSRTDWKQTKSMVLNMTIEEKRDLYKCGENYKTISDLVDWSTYAKTDEVKAKLDTSAKLDASFETDDVKAKLDTSTDSSKEKTEEIEAKLDASSDSSEKVIDEAKAKLDTSSETEANFSKNDVLNAKISLFTGDITCLEIDAIVNAANEDLAGGGGVDGAIHAAAGRQILQRECRTLDGCDTGDAKITGGYKLPAKYVIHAVGPMGQDSVLLSSCYKKSMDLLKENKLETIAFPCISTGIYGYPNADAARVALETIRKWLDEDEYSSKVKRVIFCLFLDCDIKIYHKLMPKYFPVD